MTTVWQIVDVLDNKIADYLTVNGRKPKRLVVTPQEYELLKDYAGIVGCISEESDTLMFNGVEIKIASDYCIPYFNVVASKTHCDKPKEKKVNFDEQTIITQVLENFNFDKVHKHMTAVGWGWSGLGVPSQYKLISAAEGLLKDACKRCIEQFNASVKTSNQCPPEWRYSVATGGFEAVATIYKDEDEEGGSFRLHCRLMFILSHSEAGYW